MAVTARSWLVPLGTGLGGLAAGWILASGPHTPASDAPLTATTQPQGSPIEVSPAFSKPATISLDDVRRVVREELVAARGGPAGASQTAGDTQDPQPPTPAQTAALGRASAVLDSALSRRQFTDADVDALRAEFQQLSVEQQTEVMQRYAVAVNQGRIVPQSDRLPF
jgi:hypothetical protein